MRILALLLAGCSAEVNVDPLIVEGAKSAILLIGEGSDVTAEAGRIEGEALRRGLEPEVPAVLLTYDADLIALGLTSGVLPAATPELSRALPPPDDSFTLDEAKRRWQRLDQPPDLLETFRFGLEEPFAACVISGGCVIEDRCAPDCLGTTMLAYPETPTLPVFTPCPAGWEPLMGGCSPFSMQACAADELRIPGQDCISVGTVCPARFSPQAADLYVDPSVPGPGTGTSTDPFPALDDAFSIAGDGAVISLAVGIHPASTLDVPPGVRVLGACPEQTIVTTLDDRPVMTMRGSDITIENVMLAGGRHGMSILNAASVEIRDVIVRDAALDGLIAPGIFTAERLKIVDCLRHGINSTGGATLTMVEVTGAEATGMAFGRGLVSIADSLVEGNGTRGINIASTTVTIDRTVFVANGQSGIRITSGSLTLNDVVSERNVTGAMGFGGYGLLVEGGRAQVQRLQAVANANLGISAVNAHFDATDVRVSGASVNVVEAGVGLTNTVASLERVELQDSSQIGLLIVDSTVTATDTTIGPREAAGARMAASVVHLHRFASASDVRISGTLATITSAVVGPSGIIEDPVNVSSESEARFSGLVALGGDIGIRVRDGSEMRGFGVQIEGSRVGLRVEEGGVNLTDFAIIDALTSGVELFEEGSARLLEGTIEGDGDGLVLLTPRDLEPILERVRIRVGGQAIRRDY